MIPTQLQFNNLIGIFVLCKSFYFKSYHFDSQSGNLMLNYQIDEKYHFSEQLVFPKDYGVLSSEKEALLEQIFFLTHIAFGISYYKAFLPKKIIVESGQLSQEQAAFFDKLYLNGLGEFSVKNDVDLDIHFPSSTKISHSFNLPLLKRALIPIGGGKDSCVTIELVKKISVPASLISIGCPMAIENCAQKSGLKHIVIQRTLDSLLLDLNKKGKVLNGHVPISGILAFVLWAAAVLYDYRYVVMSCERSANVGNLTRKGLKINHQYSKSFEFERDFDIITRTITPNFHYFSLLRPLSEIHIARLFSERCANYFDVFTSCNKAFKLDETKRLTHWCGCCDKCRFVFLILAVFIPKDKLIQIFGSNLLNDWTQLNGFEELLGFSGHKPFECVGEIDESRYAMQQLIDYSEWQQDKIVSYFKEKLKMPLQANLFNVSDEHLIPEVFQDVFNNFKS